MAPDVAASGPHTSWVDAYRGMSSDNIKGLVLALSSSVFIGASFIVKKKGLKKAGASGVRAGNLTEFLFFLLDLRIVFLVLNTLSSYRCEGKMGPFCAV